MERRKRDSRRYEKNCTVDARSSAFTDVHGSQFNIAGSHINETQYTINLVSITVSKENITIVILAFLLEIRILDDLESTICQRPANPEGLRSQPPGRLWQ